MKEINTNFYDNSNEIKTKISKYISQNDWISSYELGFNILFNGDKLKVIRKF